MTFQEADRTMLAGLFMLIAVPAHADARDLRVGAAHREVDCFR
jgi:hypothetical protein